MTASVSVTAHKVFKMPEIKSFLHLIRGHECAWPV